ncbi:peptidylprolyl isomerase [Marinomonas balearica]|uniref:Chaperone SurA n=1 Tax=Marinomonas balearica TaxID=491947 RepID=A0A4R6MAS8_9GAMM|nr:peptidylprolyl isomerase [Marinomonas balearica]TDO98195.1 periplasmic chaperone for outer membrane proteins SurA [Marinomonas balearica]
MMKKLVLLLSILITLSSPLNAAPKLLDGVVAIVDSHPLLESDIKTRFQVIKDRIPGGVLTDGIRRQILNQLIEETLQLNYGERLGIRIPQKNTDAAILNVAQKFSTDLNGLKQILRRQGVDYARYRQQIENEIIIGAVKQRVVKDRIAITEQEIVNFINTHQSAQSNKDEIHLRHIIVRAKNEDQARQKISSIANNISTENDFINQAITNSDGQFALEGGDLGWRPANQLPALFTQAIGNQKGPLIGPIKSNAGFHLLWVVEKRSPNTQLQAQTKTRHLLLQSNEIRSEKQTFELSKELYQRAIAGEDFASLASQYSDDKGSTLQGGDLGWVKLGTMVPAFEKVMVATKTGAISKPFKSQFGWHILKVEDRRKEDISESVKKQQAENALVAQKKDFVLSNWLDELKESAFIDVKKHQS